MLQVLKKQFNINRATIEREIEKMNKQKYLSMHEQKVWTDDKGRFYTYLKSGKERRLISSCSREGIEDKIVSHYQEKAESPSFEDVFYEWHNDRLKYNEISKGSTIF